MTKRLIMVEGMPGAGKSATTQYLSDLLNANHRPARWMEEAEAEAYFDEFWQAANRGSSDLVEPLLACWKRFRAEFEAQESTILFDASLYYHMHLLERNVDEAAIRAYTEALFDLTRDLPVTAVLLTGDVSVVFPRIASRRGPEWTAGCLGYVNSQPYQVAHGREGMAGAIAFFTDGQRLITETVKASPWAQLWIDTSAEDWAEYQGRLQVHFGCAPEAARVELSPELLERYIGEYAWPEGAPFTGPLCVKQGSTGGLYVETSYRRDLLLLPVTESRFEIQATPLSVLFTVNSEGRTLSVDYVDFGGVVWTCTRIGQ